MIDNQTPPPCMKTQKQQHEMKKKKTQCENKKRFAHEFVCFVMRKLAWLEMCLYSELFFLCHCKACWKMILLFGLSILNHTISTF
jgi:hypothetical protein